MHNDLLYPIVTLYSSVTKMTSDLLVKQVIFYSVLSLNTLRTAKPISCLSSWYGGGGLQFIFMHSVSPLYQMAYT